MKDERLKNCPECGSDKLQVRIDCKGTYPNIRRILMYVQCDNCGNHEYGQTEELAIEKWNFLADMKDKIKSGEISSIEAEHEYHDRYYRN